MMRSVVFGSVVVLALLSCRLLEAAETENGDESIVSLAKRLRDFIRQHQVEKTSAAKSTTRGGPGVTGEMKKKVLDLHEKYRKQEGASNMQSFVWNDKLARLAQDWSDRCNWGHRTHDTFQASDYGFKSVGENIWAFSDHSRTIPDQPIEDWYNEKNYYNFDSMQCSKEPCGHYTAVVWSSTREIGCGYTECPTLNGAGFNNGVYFVCNYGPGGNNYGVQPYKKGTACSECSTGKFYCTDGLCDDTCNGEGSGKCECKASCPNGHKVDGCRCQCSGDWTGPACSDQCADHSPACGANPGLPEMLCHDPNAMGGMLYDQINKDCPKLCKKCGAGSSKSASSSSSSSVKEEIFQAVESILADHNIHK
jgi:uncharacterized protein YkwD